jgi:hypothetical protein
MPLLKSPSFSRKSTLNISGSFWDPPNYKETTKRVEDGEKLVRDFVQMVEERRDIEKDYAKQLQTWSDKWMKVQEYGTMETAWRAVAMEGVKRASVHLAVREDVDNQVVEPLRAWHKDTYHRHRNQLREKKELGEQFKTAQKEWADLLNKQTTAKTEYLAACKEEERSVKAEREATKNPDLSQIQLNKLQEKIKNSQQELKIKHEKYTSSIQELNSRQNVYQQGMIQVYNKFEAFEEKRYLTVQMFMLLLQDCLNVHRNLDLSQIYDESREAINQVDHEKDLSWWSDNHGINMEHVLPGFEEYSTNVRSRSSIFSIASIRQMIPEYQDSNARSRSASFNTSKNSKALPKYQVHSKDIARKLLSQPNSTSTGVGA